MKKSTISSVIIFIVVLAVMSWLTTVSAISIDLSSFIVFIVLLGVLIYNDRKKVKLDGVIIIRRTKRGKKFLDGIAKRNPDFWNRAAKVGIVIGIIGLLAGTIFLSYQAYDIASGGKEGGVKLLLPGPVSEPVNTPGVFVVPWWIWVIGIAAVIIPHEGFHGIMCRLEKIRISSVGWLLFFIIPGAFVEPDEKQLKKAEKITKLKVYAAGSFANILVAFIIILALAASFPLMFSASGVFVHSTEGGFIVNEVDGAAVNSRTELINILSSYEINESVQMKITGSGSVFPRFDLASNPLIPEPAVAAGSEQTILINVTMSSEPEAIETMQAFRFGPGAEAVPYFHGFVLVLLWVYLFSLGVGLVNLLPIKPLDGGLIFEELADKFTKSAKTITKIVSIMVLLILIFNLIGPVFV